MEPVPRFAADAMLGRLARWLRFLGFDTTYAADVPDADLVRHALREERILLTRDTRLAERWPGVPLRRLVSERPLEQLAALLREFGGAAGDPRCTACNGRLYPVTADAVQSNVPSYVAETAPSFHRCAGCGRIYWPGTHAARMRATLAPLLPPAKERTDPEGQP